MGGGIAMRAVAKVGGIGVLNRGLRGGENGVVSAARAVASVVSSSSDDVKLAISNSELKTTSSIEKPSVDIDDWELAGIDDALYMAAGDPTPMPRLVFGGAPTMQEAKQATFDLNEALEKTYLSLKTTNTFNDSEHGDTKPLRVSETAGVQKHAIQAFRLLHESSAAQNVVASIASDLNVWDAVLKNEALVDYLQAHKTSVVFPNTDLDVNDSFICDEIPTPKASKPEPAKGFLDYVEEMKQKIRVTVVDMMDNLSDTLMSFFGGSAKGEKYTANPDGTAGVSAEKTTIGATLMGLAVMVIMVVALKRG